MQTDTRTTVARTSAIEAARLAIWHLFEEGYVDEDMATAGLLAVDVGTRRTRRDTTSRRQLRTESPTALSPTFVEHRRAA